MQWSQRIADETALHAHQLRDRRVPWGLRIAMTLVFHYLLTRTVLLDEQFSTEIAKVMAPATAETEEAPE